MSVTMEFWFVIMHTSMEFWPAHAHIMVTQHTGLLAQYYMLANVSLQVTAECWHLLVYGYNNLNKCQLSAFLWVCLFACCFCCIKQSECIHNEDKEAGNCDSVLSLLFCCCF